MIGEMRRLISLLAAVAIAAGPLAAAGGAMAKDHRDDRREESRGRGEPVRGGPARQAPPQAYRGGGQDYRGGYEQRGDPRGEFRNDPRGADYRSERVDPRYDPRYSQPPGAYQSAPRRGGYLGPGCGGPVIQDPGRRHLRPPPRGYDWVQTPGGMALVQQGTGRVYDVVPN
jgi:Ni/Co efflux regulator RcnB